RQKVWKKLADQLSHGVSFYRAVERMHIQAQRNHDYAQHAYDRLLTNNARGGSLAHGLKELADPCEILLIGVAEGENLVQGLRRAYDLLDHVGKLKQAVFGHMLYPCFLLLMLVALFVVIAYVLVPQFSLVLPPQEWEGAAKVLFWMADGVRRGGIWLPLCVPLLVIAVVLSFSRLTGGIRVFLEHFLPYSVYRDVVGASFLYSLATLMRCGVQPKEIFATILADPSQTLYLKERIWALDVEMAQGKNLGQAFLDTGLVFPNSEVVEDLLCYAELPGLELELAEIAKEELALCLENVERKMRFLQVFLLFIVFGVILFVLAALGTLQGALGQSL
ncbi:MAG: type II secretion system F family protein, partial [Desulfovibrio sp.]|nr:type II secretion system F family protein [Desulfovibrio sp.]